ncbi:MAG: 3-phosphoshikimate 1-carboxyvinyltransferase [Planctomycetes bacterium]|nr:3-phosphoshikimate 1-carboxyvinyltransferase [Planctomycetota bacterium]
MIDYTLPLDQLPDPLPIEPLTKPFDVTITPPGSKSITCRAYILAALAEGESQIIRPLRADDTDLLLKALCTLGAEARWDGEDVFIKGVGGRFPRGGEINLGDGGAPTRFMIAAACLAAEPVVVDASPRMRRRPIAEGVDMLRQLGAKIEYVEEERRLPVRVQPSQSFMGGTVAIGSTVSSQFVSALILIAPFLSAGLRFQLDREVTSPTYVQLTLNLLEEWQSDFAIPSWELVPGGQFWDRINGDLPESVQITQATLGGQRFLVESDASGAVYWVVAAWLSRRSKVTLYRFSPRPYQSDWHLVRELGHANLINQRFSWLSEDDSYHWHVERGRKTGKLKCDCSLFPDGAVVLAVGAAMMKNRSGFTGLHTLRHKETDRIAALANELRRIGCTVETTDDSIAIDPSTRHDEPVVIETYNDHRMAMAFAVLGLARPGISIKNPACVSKSYPTFWKDFAKLYQ